MPILPQPWCTNLSLYHRWWQAKETAIQTCAGMAQYKPLSWPSILRESPPLKREQFMFMWISTFTSQTFTSIFLQGSPLSWMQCTNSLCIWNISQADPFSIDQKITFLVQPTCRSSVAPTYSKLEAIINCSCYCSIHMPQPQLKPQRWCTNRMTQVIPKATHDQREQATWG